MRAITGLILLLLAVNVHAQRFKIEETTDALSRETYLRATGMSSARPRKLDSLRNVPYCSWRGIRASRIRWR
jgi:hypothetical protein